MQGYDTSLASSAQTEPELIPSAAFWCGALRFFAVWLIVAKCQSDKEIASVLERFHAPSKTFVNRLLERISKPRLLPFL